MTKSKQATTDTTVNTPSEITQKRHERNAFLFDQMKVSQNSIYFRQLLIEENLALVSSVLKGYKPYTDDKYQIGCIGLIRAVDTFNPEKGVPFSSYAWFCISRELHAEHKRDCNSFEYKMAEYMFNLDALLRDSEGEEKELSTIIEDPNAAAEFAKLLTDFHLDAIFETVIDPAIEKASGNSSKMDMAKWAQLERLLFIEMSEVTSQKARINLTTIAKELDVSTQYIKTKHSTVITNAQRIYQQKRRGGHFE